MIIPLKTCVGSMVLMGFGAKGIGALGLPGAEGAVLSSKSCEAVRPWCQLWPQPPQPGYLHTSSSCHPWAGGSSPHPACHSPFLGALPWGDGGRLEWPGSRLKLFTEKWSGAGPEWGFPRGEGEGRGGCLAVDILSPLTVSCWGGSSAGRCSDRSKGGV